MKKIFYKVCLLSLGFILVPQLLYAAEQLVKIVPSSNTVGIGEEFYVDINIEVTDSELNGLTGSINFNKNLTLVRIEDGQSIVRAWIERPSASSNIVAFSGIIPNGFSGVIDPLDGSVKKPGNIIRLVFKAQSSGEGSIAVENFSITLNDGVGTLKNINSTISKIKISNEKVATSYSFSDNIKPEIQAYIVKDENLFEGRYALVFQAIDRESGISEISVKEGDDEWEIVTNSPYLLKDQKHKSILSIKVKDFSGNESILIIRPPVSKSSIIAILVFIMVMTFVFFWYKKRNVKKL